MKKIVVLATLLTFLNSHPVVASQELTLQANTPIEEIELKEADMRVKILQAYLAKFNSPLQNHASDFIEAADTYNLDWKLVPAIAGVESTFGKRTPGGCNSWGWGVYGDKVLRFNSCRDGIFTVSEGLKKEYIDKGLTNPYTMNKKYAASPSWGWKVDFFLKDISRFEAQYNGQVLKVVEAKMPKFAFENITDLVQSVDDPTVLSYLNR